MLRDPDGRRDLLECGVLPGTSPFKIKGVAYRGHLEYVEDNISGGLAAFEQEISDEKLKAFFFDQTFLPSTLYDIIPLAIAGIICGDMTGTSFLDFVHLRTRAQAELDISGIYRFLLKLVTAKLTAIYFPRVQAQYFSFGVCETKAVSASVVQGAYRGIPELLAPWYEVVVRAYTECVLTKSSKNKATYRALPQEAEEPKDGFPMMTLPFEVEFGRSPDPIAGGNQSPDQDGPR